MSRLKHRWLKVISQNSALLFLDKTTCKLYPQCNRTDGAVPLKLCVAAHIVSGLLPQAKMLNVPDTVLSKWLDVVLQVKKPPHTAQTGVFPPEISLIKRKKHDKTTQKTFPRQKLGSSRFLSYIFDAYVLF